MTNLETIVLEHGSSRACLAPERGGMVTRFSVGGRELLYLDEGTLLDRTKNVRGGNPILFPSPGKLEGGPYRMDQHGFARTSPWNVLDRTTDRVTLELRSSEATRALYPWDFVATYTTILSEGVLRIEQRFEGAMAFGAGFHPYFLVRDKTKARVTSPATRAWDNAAKKAVSPPVIDLTQKELDLHLLDHGSSRAALELEDGRIEVRGSPEFRRWVIWTLEGKDFVCLEPWTSPGNALNDRVDLLVAPTEIWTEIAWVST